MTLNLDSSIFNVDATERDADSAVAWLRKAIDAAEASNQAGENAVVKAALAIGWKKP
jgi:hypothetical protein